MTRLRDIRNQRGQVALEFIAVVMAWILSVVLMFDMVILLGNAMIYQSSLNRVALQAAAQGCLSTQSAQSILNLQSNSFISYPQVIDARTPNINTAVVGASFNRSDVANANGDPLPPTTATNAVCDTTGPGVRDKVPNGHYIWIYLKYTQHFLLFGSWPMTRTALVISNSLTETGR